MVVDDEAAFIRIYFCGWWIYPADDGQGWTFARVERRRWGRGGRGAGTAVMFWNSTIGVYISIYYSAVV